MKNLFEKIMASRYGWLLLLLFLGAINFLASLVHSRIDLTKEKRYTLSKATRDLLQAVDDNVQIDVFLKGEFPAGFRKLANSTGEFLQLLKDKNGSKIHYRFISPQEKMPGTEATYEDSISNLGASAINLTVQVKAGEENKRIYPVALMTYKGKQTLVNLYSGGKRMITPVEMNSAEALMEYQFAKSLSNLINPGKPLIGYSFGNGEPTDARTYGLQQALESEYRLALLNINEQPVNPDTFKILLVVKPTLPFSENEKLKLDQYVMGGGKLLFFVDDLIAEQDSLRYKPEIIAYDRNLNLTDLLFRYGVRINPSLVMDLQCDFLPFAVGGSQENPQFEFLHWNYYPLFEGKSTHTINKNLGLVAGRFVNSIDTINTPGIGKTVLLSSSANSRVITTPALISLNENRNVAEDAKFKQADIPVAILLEGQFTSLYRNRISQSQKDLLAGAGMNFRESSPNNKMIIVADGDMVLNDVSTRDGPLALGVNLFTSGSQYEYQFANREFLLNCIEYLVNNPAISETRNKDIVLRLLDTKKVQENKTFWQLINIALPVLLVIISGFVYQAIRKRKYASK
ncbi:MAG: gliding motility-associated ABC transporter substrate-binding protein GldG [Chitinophagaceae bacterium]